jgi:GNAT superfamily N-acetyltransferase
MIIIREANTSDIETIISFQLKMAMETEKIRLKESLVTKGVSAVFDHPELGRYYVAEKEGRVCASLLVTPEWSDWRSLHVLWIQSVFVIPEERKKGIFKQMYSFLRQMVENSQVYAGLRLYVDRSNFSAKEVYKAIGMNHDHYELFEWMKPPS